MVAELLSLVEHRAENLILQTYKTQAYLTNCITCTKTTYTAQSKMLTCHKFLKKYKLQLLGEHTAFQVRKDQL